MQRVAIVNCCKRIVTAATKPIPPLNYKLVANEFVWAENLGPTGHVLTLLWDMCIGLHHM